jgi:mRNA-degrading endonuclease toxin of MazEF toxin-antitoxin module
MTQHGGNPQEFQDHRQGRRPATTKFDGMWHIFFGVPLTTKIKQHPSYFPMRFKDREQCVMLSQLRLWDGKRLTHKMGQLPDDQFEAVKQALRRLLK